MRGPIEVTWMSGKASLYAITPRMTGDATQFNHRIYGPSLQNGPSDTASWIHTLVNPSHFAARLVGLCNQ